MLKSSFKIAAAVAAFISTSPPASADNLVFSYTLSAQSWFTTLAQSVRLSEGGVLRIPFTNPVAGLVSVTFTAECQIIAASTSTLGVDIWIDNTVVPVTNGDDAICAGRGANVQGGWTRHSITVARSLTAGSHFVRVDAITSGLHNGARLDDVTLLISR